MASESRVNLADGCGAKEKDMFLMKAVDNDGDNPIVYFADEEKQKCLKDSQESIVTMDEDRERDMSSSSEYDEYERHTWSRKAEYLLSMVGYCVGLGNIWRFPYVCMRNGGGAFLIPFFISLMLCGLPLYFMEVAIGQFVSKSSYHVWGLCPLIRGIGLGMNLMALVSCWYYNTILGWTLMYLANSVKSPLPWTQCDQDWNTPNCVPQGGRKVNTTLEGLARNVSALAGFGENVTVDLTGNYSSSASSFASEVNHSLSTSASEEFWLNKILQLSPGMDQMNGIQWYISLACLISLIIVFICVIKGVQTVGKVVYITATVPYILITILIIKGATLPGALDGVIFYIQPDFSKLLSVQTWIEANLQVFYSLGPCWGGLITMASYNKFSNNCIRDSIALSFLCEGTSVFAGLAIFTVVGHMADTLGVPISNFDKTGAGLAFVVYPEAISYLPVPQLWGVLFFFMLFTVGLDSMFVTVEIILTTIADMCPRLMRRFPFAIKVAFMLFLFLSSLIFTARGGMYVFQLADWYIGAFTPLAIGILECSVIAWVYGANRFQEDIKLMVGHRPPFIFEILWKFVTPLLLVINMVFALHSYKAPVFENYTYGFGGVTFGWIIALSSFVPIPVCAIYMLCQSKGTLKERLVSSCTPASDWEPADPSLRVQYRRNNKNWTVCEERICPARRCSDSSDEIPC